jgi:hypothetical protein
MPPSVSQKLHSPFAQSPRGGPPTFSYAAITPSGSQPSVFSSLAATAEGGLNRFSFVGREKPGSAGPAASAHHVRGMRIRQMLAPGSEVVAGGWRRRALCASESASRRSLTSVRAAGVRSCRLLRTFRATPRTNSQVRVRKAPTLPQPATWPRTATSAIPSRPSKTRT